MWVESCFLFSTLSGATIPIIVLCWCNDSPERNCGPRRESRAKSLGRPLTWPLVFLMPQLLLNGHYDSSISEVSTVTQWPSRYPFRGKVPWFRYAAVCVDLFLHVACPSDKPEPFHRLLLSGRHWKGTPWRYVGRNALFGLVKHCETSQS